MERTYDVRLRLRVNPETEGNPAKWAWPTLLDLRPDQVLRADAVELDADDLEE